MSYEADFQRIGRKYDLLDAEIERLQAEIERKKESRAQADAFLKTFIGDAVVEPVADEPVIAPVPVVDDQPEIISEPVKDEPVIVAATVVADEPVIVAPASAPSADSDLGAFLAAIQRAGVKVGNDFQPVVVADNPEPPVVETVTADEPEPNYRQQRATNIAGTAYFPVAGQSLDGLNDIYAKEITGKDVRDVVVEVGGLVWWFMMEAENYSEPNCIDADELAICQAMARHLGEWMTANEIYEAAQSFGYAQSRTNIFNRISDGRRSLMGTFLEFIEEATQGKKRVFRMVADIDLAQGVRAA